MAIRKLKCSLDAADFVRHIPYPVNALGVLRIERNLLPLRRVCGPRNLRKIPPVTIQHRDRDFRDSGARSAWVRARTEAGACTEGIRL
jgi:hypothetical protein